jgi:hypothetical protein
MMDPATEHRTLNAKDAFLAGLQAGLVALLWMLIWLGMSSILERRGFWAPENLLASAFYGNRAIRTGFGFSTLSGISLYILIYCPLGALFAMSVRRRLPRFRLTLTAVAVSLLFYYLTFCGLWKTLAPLAAVLHSRSATVLGHVIFGAMLARFPAYLPGAGTPQGATTADPSESASQPQDLTGMIEAEVSGSVGEQPPREP